MMEFIISALAVWRLSRLIAKDDGPWGVFLRLRAWAGQISGSFGLYGAISCVSCISVYFGAIIALAGSHSLLDWLLKALALSGAAIALESLSKSRT